MEKDKIIVLENRGLISVTGDDAKSFLQNIITNDVNKVNKYNSAFSAIFTPQGKYLYEFFLIKSEDKYFLECDNEFTSEIVEHLSKFKLRSKIEIKNQTSEYVVGIISLDKFKEIQTTENKAYKTISYRGSPVFIDPRTKELGARILSSLEKLHLTIKKLNLKITNSKNYLNRAHMCGVPIIGIKNLKDQLFGLEANFEELNAIDFKKGCYVGQENTARMKLKNKLRKRLLPIKTDQEIKAGSELLFENIKIGKVLIGGLNPFALVKLFDPDFSDFRDKDITIDNKKVKIINSY